MRKQVTLLLFSFFVLYASLPLFAQGTEVQENVELKLEETLTLKNILNISFFNIPDNGSEEFYFGDTQQAKIGKYEIGDSSKENIGNYGRGPFEYINPELLKVKNSRIYIWDASQLKFLVFDTDGNGISLPSPAYRPQI